MIDITSEEKQAIVAHVHETNLYVPKLDQAQAELARLDEQIAGCAAELSALDALIGNVTIESDLTKVAEAKIRRPLLVDRLRVLRDAAAELQQKVESYQQRIQYDIRERIVAGRRALARAHEG